MIDIKPTINEIIEIKKYLNKDQDICKQQLDNLSIYVKSLLLENEKHNLIGKNTIQTIWSRHILDCLQLVKYLPNVSNDYTILDLGSGAGLPAVVLAIATEKKIVMVEKSPVKAKFLSQVCQELHIKNTIINKTIDGKNITECFNNKSVITSRAFKSIGEIFGLLDDKPLINKIEKIILLKGRTWEQELQQVNKKIFQTWSYSVSDSISKEGVVLEFVKNNQ